MSVSRREEGDDLVFEIRVSKQAVVDAVFEPEKGEELTDDQKRRIELHGFNLAIRELAAFELVASKTDADLDAETTKAQLDANAVQVRNAALKLARPTPIDLSDVKPIAAEVALPEVADEEVK